MSAVRAFFPFEQAEDFDLQWNSGTLYIGNPHRLTLAFIKHHDLLIITSVLGCVTHADRTLALRIFRNVGVSTVGAYRYKKNNDHRYVEFKIGEPKG